MENAYDRSNPAFSHGRRPAENGGNLFGNFPATFDDFCTWASERYSEYNGQEGRRGANAAGTDQAGSSETTADGPGAGPDLQNGRANAGRARFEPANLDRYAALIVAQALLFLSQLALAYSARAVKFVFSKISGFLYRSLLYVTLLVLQYTVLAPILAPYYTVRAYWRRADLIWRTSQSLWAFLCRLWNWFSGGQKVRSQMDAEIRAKTGDSMEEKGEGEEPTFAGQPPNYGNRNNNHNNGRTRPITIKIGDTEYNLLEYAVWLLLFLPLVFSVFWLFQHYFWPGWLLEKFLKIFRL